MVEDKKVAIICPVWNGEDDLPDLFKNLSEINYDKKKLDLIFIDNFSQDKSVTIVKEMFKKIETDGWSKLVLIENNENIGIPAAYNQCYSKVTSDTFAVLRIETDIMMNSDALQNMLSLFINDKSIGVVGSYIDGPDKCGAIYFSKWLDKKTILYPDTSKQCDGVLGCCMLIRKSAVEKLDYFFDSNLFIGKDETDLSIRLSDIGYLTYYQPEAHVYHKSGKSTSKISSITRYYYVRNGIIMLKKHANFPKLIYRLSHSLIYVIWWRLNGDKVSLKAYTDGLFFDIKHIKTHKVISL